MKSKTSQTASEPEKHSSSAHSLCAKGWQGLRGMQRSAQQKHPSSTSEGPKRMTVDTCICPARSVSKRQGSSMRNHLGAMRAPRCQADALSGCQHDRLKLTVVRPIWAVSEPARAGAGRLISLRGMDPPVVGDQVPMGSPSLPPAPLVLADSACRIGLEVRMRACMSEPQRLQR
jgi:hypothetical protein